jgi:lysophospholipase
VTLPAAWLFGSLSMINEPAPAPDMMTRRRSLPAGGAVAMVAMADGWMVRTAVWRPRDPALGMVLMVGGRGDFIEKYAEALHDLVEAGWGVATFDWRGQGLSGRLGDAPEKGHCNDFGVWLDDLDQLMTRWRADMPGRWVAVAHSMGGHLVLRRLTTGGADFARVVLLSPLLGLLAPPLGPRLARIAARVMVMAGRGGDYVYGGGPRIKAPPGSPRQLMLTSDAERYGDEGWWAEQEPRLSMGSATWGWLNAAFRSLALLWDRLGRVQTPVLVMIPTTDGLVDNAATRAAMARIPGARLEVIACTGHELLRECDAVRSQVVARVRAFLA